MLKISSGMLPVSYHFVPDYAAYEKDGEPSLYFNCIIGSVHRYYNYAPIHDMLLRLGRLREPISFADWSGLDWNAVLMSML